MASVDRLSKRPEKGLSRIARLAEQRALKKSHKPRNATYASEEQDKLYDEVDEEGYKDVVRKRLLEDDFVVDDNGEGYVDNGMDDWGTQEPYSDESDTYNRPSKYRSGRRDAKNVEKVKAEREIKQYFVKNTASNAPLNKTTTREDANFMAGLLDTFEETAPLHMTGQKLEPKARFRESSPLRTSLTKRMKMDYKGLKHELPSSPPPLSDSMDMYTPDVNLDSDMTDMPETPSSPTTQAIKRKVPEPEAEMIIAKPLAGLLSSRSERASVNIAPTRMRPKVMETPSKLSNGIAFSPSGPVEPSQWLELGSKLKTTDSPKPSAVYGKIKAEGVLEEDGSLKMFWTDVCDVGGILCLFGKVQVKASHNYVSCFLRVDGILRNLYFLPRDYKLANGRETDEEVTIGDVYSEVSNLFTKAKIDSFKSKPCTRKYAFELPDIPQQSEYLKVLYPYSSRSVIESV